MRNAWYGLYCIIALLRKKKLHKFKTYTWPFTTPVKTERGMTIIPLGKNFLVFWINYKKYGGWNRPIYRRSSGPPKLTHYTHQKAQKKLKAIFSFFKYKRSIFIFDGSIKITYISKTI